MTNSISIIQHPQFGEIRTLQSGDDPLFCAQDVCTALDYNQTVANALQKLDDDEKLMSKISTSGQNRDMWFVNESGLYNLIFRSNKPEAKTFRKWVTGEVLPAIRRNGYYGQPAPQVGYLSVRSNAENTVSFLNLFYRELMAIDNKNTRHRLAGYVEHFVNILL